MSEAPAGLVPAGGVGDVAAEAWTTDGWSGTPLGREIPRAGGPADEPSGNRGEPPAEEGLATAFEFRSGNPYDDGPGASLPVDLTVGAAADELSAAEQAIVEAIRAEPTAVGLWRSWRVPAAGASWSPPTRVFVVTVEAPSPSPLSAASASATPSPSAAVASRLRTALLAAGEPDPWVEVGVVGMVVPSHQLLARMCGALLWSREPAVGVTIARVFDEVDPIEGPRFAPNHPRIGHAAVRARLLGYLDHGTVLFDPSVLMPDVLDPARGDVVPMTYRTDGRWVWTDVVGYYLREYGIAPEPDFRRHVEHGRPVDRLDEVVLHRVLAVTLSRPGEGGGAWTVPPAREPTQPDET